MLIEHMYRCFTNYKSKCCNLIFGAIWAEDISAYLMMWFYFACIHSFGGSRYSEDKAGQATLTAMAGSIMVLCANYIFLFTYR